MPNIKFERLSGDTNGVNRLFQTSRLYVSGSVAIFINGLSMDVSDDEWTELGAGQVRLKYAPRDSDIVQAVYYAI